MEAFETAAQHSDKCMFMYSILANAANWEKEFVSAHPDMATELADLHAHLANFDTLVFSNGGKDNNAFILETARLAGVKTRMVNLGPLTGGYVSPLFFLGGDLVHRTFPVRWPQSSRNSKRGGNPSEGVSPSYGRRAGPKGRQFLS